MDKSFDKKSQLSFEIFFFGLIAVFLFWRAKYGYYGNDENFLFGLAQRLYYGESLLTDEWHLAQHAGLFIWPFYSLFYSINHAVDGMSLYFRYIYCAVYLAALVYVNYKLSEFRPYTYPFIFCTALYTPLDHMTLSYTSLSFILVLLMSVKIYKDVLREKSSTAKNGISLGLIFTALTLLYPYFAVVAAIYYIVLALYWIYSKLRHKENCKYIYSLSFYAAASIALCVVFYCVFLFSRTSLESIIINFPELFNDPQHPQRKFIFSIYDAMYTSLMTGRETLMSGLVYYGFSGILIVLSFCSKRVRKYRALILFFMLPLWLYNEWDIFLETYPKLNRQMKDIFMVGILAFALMENRPWKLFLSFYPLSVIYLVVTWFSSNTGLHVLSMGYSLGSVCAVLIISLLIGELGREYKGLGWKRAAAMSAAVLLVLGQACLEIRVRYDRTYHDYGLTEMQYKIEHGPSKGIYTSKKNYDEYYAEFNSLNYLLASKEKEGKTFLALNSSPLVYLAADMPCVSYSKWMLGDNNSVDRVKKYMVINEKDSPDYIYDHLGTEDISSLTDEEYDVITYNEAKLYIKKPVS